MLTEGEELLQKNKVLQKAESHKESRLIVWQEKEKEKKTQNVRYNKKTMMVKVKQNHFLT